MYNVMTRPLHAQIKILVPTYIVDIVVVYSLIQL